MQISRTVPEHGRHGTAAAEFRAYQSQRRVERVTIGREICEQAKVVALVYEVEEILGAVVTERFFGRGDLKYVILELLKDQPRHGYDIIRALEERMRGRYRPSPGSVYPTLQMLEDLGYVTSTQEEGKKVYTITDEGRRYLEDERSTVDDIRSRITSGWEAAQQPEVADVMHEVQQMLRALFRSGTRSLQTPERLRRLRELVARHRAELEAFDNEPRTAPTGAPPSEPRMV